MRTIHIRVRRIATVLAFLACALGCNRAAPAASTSRESKSNADSASEPSFVTVIVDFSASFAPLTQADRVALKETARGLAELAIQEWNPPTTIVWRKIGAESTNAAPLCDTIEYNRKVLGAMNAADGLRGTLDKCVETVINASRVRGSPEPYTDIGDAMMLASQNWAALPGRKTLVILSDFLEDLPKGRLPTSVLLHGEHILMLHRPGTTETSDSAVYLTRIGDWKRRMLAAGAGSVVALPIFRTTIYEVQNSLSENLRRGTSVLLVTDLGASDNDGPLTKRAIGIVSKAVADLAGNWPAPVTATWFGATRPAWHTKSVAPVVFVPRLAQRSDEVNTADKFKTQLEEWGLALQQQSEVGDGDIDGVLRLVNDDKLDPSRFLILLSKFNFDPPPASNPAMNREQVVIVYTPPHSGKGGDFFRRISEWEQYFKKSGATNVCSLDLGTLTESTIEMCLQQNRETQ
jgi:hypothetical protein